MSAEDDKTADEAIKDERYVIPREIFNDVAALATDHEGTRDYLAVFEILQNLKYFDFYSTYRNPITSIDLFVVIVLNLQIFT